MRVLSISTNPVLELPFLNSARGSGDFYVDRLPVLVVVVDRLPGGLDAIVATDDVTDVWMAFGREFAWVAGVPGNHDMFGANVHPSPPLSGNLHYLDNGHVSLDGLRIVGLGGIIGNPRRPHRRSDEDFVQCLDGLLPQDY